MNEDNIVTNSNTLAGEREKSDECSILLRMVLQMKEKDVVEAKILSKGDEPLAKWLQSMQFKFEMILSVEEGLKEMKNKVNEAQNKGFELIRELHIDSQTSGQGKALIDVSVMKEKFIRFLDSLVHVSASSMNIAA